MGACRPRGLRYLYRIVNRCTTAETNNDEFCLYGHLVVMQSGQDGFFAATIYKTTDRYSGEIACFSFDYWTMKLYVEEAETADIAINIERAFTEIYGTRLRISSDWVKIREE